MSQFALQIVEVSNPRDDENLVDRARAGDAAAIDRLVRLYLKDVVAVTTRLLDDRELAHDAAQDAMVNALNALHRFRGDASFRTWVLRIAVNAARSAGRRRTRRREVSLDDAGEPAEDSPDLAAVVVMRSEAARASELLRRLPEKQKLAVMLRTQQGLSYREIGEIAGCSEGAARVNYHLGLKRLRELMK